MAKISFALSLLITFTILGTDAIKTGSNEEFLQAELSDSMGLVQHGGPGGSQASVSWVDADGSVHLRTYLSKNGQIIEQCWDGSWSDGGFSAPGDSASAVVWTDDDGTPHLRVYVSDQGSIQEYAYDNGWYDGSFRYSGVSSTATAWNRAGKFGIRVNVNNEDGAVTEYCWDDGPWFVGGFSFQ